MTYELLNLRIYSRLELGFITMATAENQKMWLNMCEGGMSDR
jgi:hypothetical protein